MRPIITSDDRIINIDYIASITTNGDKVEIRMINGPSIYVACKNEEEAIVSKWQLLDRILRHNEPTSLQQR